MPGNAGALPLPRSRICANLETCLGRMVGHLVPSFAVIVDAFAGCCASPPIRITLSAQAATVHASLAGGAWCHSRLAEPQPQPRLMLRHGV